MPVKFEWDLDPGSGGDLHSCFHLDHVLNTSNGDTEAEFYSNPGISPTLPNDDIWKKFDMNNEFGFDVELDDFLEDVASVTYMSPMYTQSMTKDAREIRNHDCMWAGHCVSEKHDRNQKIQKCVSLLPVKKLPSKPEEPKVVAVTTPEGTLIADGKKVCIRKNAVVAPTHARSLLLPTRVVSTPVKGTSLKNAGSAGRFNKSGALDSGGESPRPETPQSLSDNEDLNLDLPDIKTVEEFAVDTFGYNFVSDIVNNVGSDVTNSDDGNEEFDLYLEREISIGRSITEFPSKLTGGAKLSRTNGRQDVPVARHYTTHSFFSDHCYHLSKNARMDNLGVQTPSDSEEEIDVETVYGESKKPSSRSSSSSGGVLPTNPSFSDRQQIQLTMASAINKKEVKRQGARGNSSVPGRLSLDERTLKSKTLAYKRKMSVKGGGEARRTGSVVVGGGVNGMVVGNGGGVGSKRSAQSDDCNDYVNKSLKRRKYQYQRHFKTGKSKKARNKRNYVRSFGGVSSESEVDSSERRTIHNSMERQRRIDLRNAFEELRKLVPFTAANEKAPKVVILSYGAEYCRSLTLEEAELTRKKAELRRQQEMLRAKVSQLRRSLAARR